jgi:hypothetical protein
LHGSSFSRNVVSSGLRNSCSAACVSAASITHLGDPTPHSHADLCWLQTLAGEARVSTNAEEHSHTGVCQTSLPHCCCADAMLQCAAVCACRCSSASHVPRPVHPAVCICSSLEYRQLLHACTPHVPEQYTLLQLRPLLESCTASAQPAYPAMTHGVLSGSSSGGGFTSQNLPTTSST